MKTRSTAGHDDGGDDPFPATATVDPTTTHDQEIVDNDIDPAQIALPPSPTHSKPFLPHRAPRSWVPISPRASPDARLPSASCPLVVGGRTVSGALQYAMHPLPTEASREHGHNDTKSAAQTILDNGVHQDQDEVWMAFVRQQLGSLFPDFFQTPLQDDDGEVDDIDSMRRATATAQDGGRTYGIPQLGPVRASSRGIPETAGAPLGVPDVRGELRGLKDEIELLRGMVGGMAAGMQARGVPPALATEPMHLASTPPATATPLDTDTEAGVQSTAQADNANVQGQQPEYPLPEEFYRTAHITYNLIRAVDHAMIKHRESSSSGSRKAGTAGEREEEEYDVGIRTDIEIFDEQSLYALGNSLLELFAAGKAPREAPREE